MPTITHGLALILCYFTITASTFGEEAMNQHCKKEFHIDRGQSPWQGYTESYQQEQAGKSIAAIPMTATFEPLPHLASFSLSGTPFLAIDRAARRVVVNNAVFSDLKRPDTTRMKPGTKFVMGKIVSESLLARPWEVVAFLLESQLIETYQHLEATFSLQSEEESAENYQVVFKGTHIYFTNDRNEDPIAFRVTIDKKTGEIIVTGE